MNRHEFYDKLNEYKSLSHSNDYKYYNKIDLGNGKTRYFYTKAEWDAYQEGETRNKYEQQKKTIANNKAADEAKAKANQENSTVIKNNKQKEEAKKIAEQKNNMSDYNKWKQQQEIYKKNAEASKYEDDRKGYKSNWEKGLSSYNSTHMKPQGRDRSDNIRRECDVYIDDKEINDTLNNFYNAIDMGTFIGGFDSTGMENYHNSLWKGDKESAKDLASRIQRSIDIYEQDIDKFEKQLNEYLKERYGDKEWKIKKDHDAVMNSLKEKYKNSKETYDKITNNFEQWRKDKIDDYFSEELNNGLSNQKSIDKLKDMGIDAYVDYIMEYKGYNNTKAYDSEAIEMMRDVARRICRKTLSENKE